MTSEQRIKYNNDLKWKIVFHINGQTQVGERIKTLKERPVILIEEPNLLVSNKKQYKMMKIAKDNKKMKSG